jgi:glutamate-1-semialdehyde aminotransferase
MFLISLAPTQSRRIDPARQRAIMDAFVVGALNGGIMLHPDLTGFVSAAHTDEQIDQAAQVFATVLTDIKADGLFATVASS